MDEFSVPTTTFRDGTLKWNGWGYNDAFFALNADGDVYMTGQRYEGLSGKVLPHLLPWIVDNLGVDPSYTTPSFSLHALKVKVPPPLRNEAFMKALRTEGISFSNAPVARLVRSHGQTLHDILGMRRGGEQTNNSGGVVMRVPDLVVWPKGEGQVEKVVGASNAHNVALIPIGGGTSVSGALSCPEEEGRCICSLDMSLMDRVLWVDERNLLCRVEAGLLGQELERHLNSLGYTCGHEPDSIEFSSVGGWISTRASGMKKNRYGNIEDLLVHVNLVTSKGVLRRSCQVPRQSTGPDLHHIVLGSEGTYGVITEVTLKIFPLPACKRYGSILFPDFSRGIAFFREVAKQRCQCASLRLVDNEQFRMGQAMKTKADSKWKEIYSTLSRLYVTKWKGFDAHSMAAATCLFEGGSEKEVDEQAKRLYSIAGRAEFGGMPSGEENGQYGYRLTFAIAYLRDLGMEYSLIGESFETSIPWNRVEDVCRNVKLLLVREAKAHGIKYPVLATSRVTQVYDAGACVYFYFGFNYRGLDKDPVEVYEAIEVAARDEILACGGSLSHHHGVGKHRRRWMSYTVGTVGVDILRSIKAQLDPNNVFASQNLLESPTTGLFKEEGSKL